MEGVGHSDGSAAIRPLLSLPLAGIDRKTQFVTTRLVAAGETVVVHPLLPPAELAWVAAKRADVTLHVESVSASTAALTLKNAAPTPLFYAVLTTRFDGRFETNLLYLPPRSETHVSFLFEASVAPPTAKEFEESLHMDWLNRAV